MTHQVDAIVWLIASHDRALEVDEDFFDKNFKDNCTKEQSTRLTFAVSKADAIEPIHGDGWNETLKRPGAAPATNLDDKRRQVAAARRRWSPPATLAMLRACSTLPPPE